MSLLDGLVAYWKLDEEAGVRYDSGPNHFDLSDTNSVGSAVGKIASGAGLLTGNKLSFGGQMGASWPWSTFTWAGWVNVHSFDGTCYSLAWLRWYTSGATDMRLTCKTDYYGKNQFEVLGGGPSCVTDIEGGFTTDVFHFICFTYDLASHTTSIQVDNGPVFTGGGALAQPSAPDIVFSLGGRVEYNTLNGIVDEFGVWDRVLSAEEKTQLYNADDGLTYPFTIPVSGVSVAPESASIYAGGSVEITASVTGGDGTSGVIWSAPAGGTFADGTFTAIFTADTPGTYHVVATSMEDETKSATATVTVYAPVSVSIDPETANVYAGGTIQLVAEVTGGMGDTSVTWAAPDGGEVVDGLFTAPAVPGEYRVIATSNEYGPKSATATITVERAVAVDTLPIIANSVAGPAVLPRIAN